MNLKCIFWAWCILLVIGCGQERQLEDIVTVNDQGVTEIKQEVLSVEDVQKLQEASHEPAYSYTAVLSSGMTKEYPFTLDSGRKLRCELNVDQSGLAKLELYKEITKVTQLDSTTRLRYKDMSKIKEGDTIEDVTKKFAKYKAVVKASGNLTPEASVSYTLRIFN